MSAKMNAVRLLSAALLALVVGVALGYLLPRPAPTNPTLSLSATSVVAGTQYSVKLSGFPANTEIYGWVVNENPPKTFEAGTTDAQGELNLTGLAPQTPGTWLLCASDKANQYWAEAVLTVT
jgi:hypothetical protein